MTRQVLFNGAVLIRAGGASKVDASAFQSLGAGGVGVVGLIGEADAGEPNVAKLFRTPQAMVEEYKSGPLADAADLAFRPMNDPRVPGGATAVVAVKVNTSVQGTLTLQESTNDTIKLLAREYGVHTNKITAALATSGSGKILTLKYDDGVSAVEEVSPVLGGTAEFTL